MKNKYAKEKKAENDRIMSFENINYLMLKMIKVGVGAQSWREILLINYFIGYVASLYSEEM